MRIISKHKDYYDYFQGIFGIDNNKIYQRSNYVFYEKFESIFYDYEIRIFAINNKLYPFISTKKGITYISKEDINPIKGFGRIKVKGIKLTWLSYLGLKDIFDRKEVLINKEHREPIVLGRLNGTRIVWERGHPIMKSFNFQQRMDPKELYIEVETFLGYLKDFPEIENTQTDIEKLQSHGFDKKKSFRHR